MLNKALILFLQFLLAFFWIPVSFAGEEDEEEWQRELEEELELLQDEDVVFSASKHEQKVGFSPSAVVVITKEDIEKSGATSFPDLLRRWPVTRIFEIDPMVVTMEVRLMYRILILVDGREAIWDVFTAPFLPVMPVALNEIERIEIVLGPNSAVYGPNAVSAVINVITRRPDSKPKAEVSVYSGERGSVESDAWFHFGVPFATFGFFAGNSLEDSWMESGKRAKEIYRAGMKGEFVIGENRIDTAAGFVYSKGMGFANIGYMYDSGTWNSYAALKFTHGDIFTLMASWNGIDAPLNPEIDLYYPPLQLSLGKIKDIDLTGHIANLEAKVTFQPWHGNYLVIGADTRYSRYHAVSLVQNNVEEIRAGAYFHDEQNLGKYLVIQSGLRYDWNSITKQALSPRGALIFNPVEDHYFRLSGGMAFRKPTIMETSMNFEIDANPVFPEVKDLFEKYGLSNPNLDNEILSSVELGWTGKFFGKKLRGSLNSYAAFARNMIGFASNVVFDQTPMGPRLNLKKSEIGFENTTEDLDIYGCYLDMELVPWRWIEFFARMDIRYALFTERNYEVYSWQPKYVIVLGANLLLEDWRGQVVWRLNGGNWDVVYNQASVFAEREIVWLPYSDIFLLYIARKFVVSPFELEVGLNVFNPVNKGFREEAGSTLEGGKNFGGEILGRRVMLMVKASY